MLQSYQFFPIAKYNWSEKIEVSVKTILKLELQTIVRVSTFRYETVDHGNHCTISQFASISTWTICSSKIQKLQTDNAYHKACVFLAFFSFNFVVKRASCY